MLGSRRLIVYGGALILGLVLGGLLFLGWNPFSETRFLGAGNQQALEPLNPLFPSPDKTNYTMSLSLDVDHMTLTGRSRITTVNTSGRRLSQLWLTVYPNIFRDEKTTPVPLSAYGSSFVPGYVEFTRVLVNGKQAVVGNRNVSVQLDLSETIAPEEPVTVEMDWVLYLPPVAYRLGYQQGVFMLGNFYPYLQVYNRQGWHHPPEVKFGDPFCQAAADYTVAITVPGGYQVVAGAQLTNRFSNDRGMETWIFSSARARDFTLVAFLPDYRVESRQVGKVQVKAWGKSSTLPAVAEQAAKTLSYYQQIFIPYTRRELNLVEVPMQGFMGMEYDGLIFLAERALATDYSSDQRANLVAHEIAHQWWYALVGNDQAQEPWLDEGLASWSAQLYARQQGKSINQSTSSSHRLNWPLNAFGNREQYMEAVYSGGDWFWQEVEKGAGKGRLLTGLRAYLKDYAGQIASTGDMFSALMQAGVDRELLYNCWQRR